jgi:hypothetical protein
MNHNLILLIIVVIISSVIFLYNCRTMLYFKENFQNSQDVLNALQRNIDSPSGDRTQLRSGTDVLLMPGEPSDENDATVSEPEFDTKGNILRKFDKIDTQNMYKDILLSEDIVIDAEPVAKPTFEILDTIIKDDNNLFRTMQFENNERELLPKPKKETVNLKDRYSSNYIEVPMQERSLNMATHTHMYNNIIDIEDPIQDAYLPYSQNQTDTGVKSVEQNNYEYMIIALYKELLERNPTKVELERYTKQMISGDIDESILKINLINTVEYRRNIKLQSNEVANDIEYEFAKKDLIYIVSNLYFKELNKEVPKGMLMPLKDIWIYFQGNQYLFRAMLVDKNFSKFQDEIMETKLLTKANLSRLVSKYFILYDLKMKANDIQRYDVLSRKQKEVDGVATTQYMDKDLKNEDTSSLYKTIDKKSDELDKSKNVKYPNNDYLYFSKDKITNILQSTYASV